MATKACECGCGRTFEVDDAPHGGRPRRYYDRACRKRAQRKRDENARWIPAVSDVHLHVDPPKRQLASTIIEAGTVAAAFHHFATHEPNPRLAAGAEYVYLAITEALDRNFPGWRG